MSCTERSNPMTCNDRCCLRPSQQHQACRNPWFLLCTVIETLADRSYGSQKDMRKKAQPFIPGRISTSKSWLNSLQANQTHSLGLQSLLKSSKPSSTSLWDASLIYIFGTTPAGHRIHESTESWSVPGNSPQAVVRLADLLLRLLAQRPPS